MFSYQLEWKYESNDGAVCMLMDIMIDERKNDDERYLEVCEKNRENGKKWGAKKWNQNARKDWGKQPKQPNGIKNNQTPPKQADNDSDIWLLSNDNNVDKSILYESYPFKDKWIDKQVCDKLIDKQLKQWATIEWMLKEMKLEQLELRVKQWNTHRYWKKLENRLREYVEWMADSEDRLRELLVIHRKRLESWPPYRKNPRDELCDLFWTDYVKKLFMETKQWMRLFTN